MSNSQIDVITLPREELKQVLEALESCGYTPENEMVFNPQKVQDARYALRARLAQPEQRPEPVAWMHESPERVDVIHAKVKQLYRDLLSTPNGVHRPLDKTERYTIPLYLASPPPSQQRSEEEMTAERVARWLEDHDKLEEANMVRAIERKVRG